MVDLPSNAENLDPTSKWHAEWRLRYPQYEERPVDLKTFINSPLYLNAEQECWEPIKDDLQELFRGYDDPEMNWHYNEAVFDEGIGGGKTYRASIIITYLVYRTLILKDPHKLFHLAKGSGIYLMNMSLHADQAKRVVFGEITQRIQNSPWFRSKNYLPNDRIKSELQMPKNITIIPGNSKETFPQGYNLLGGVMDEAAWYTETESHDVAEEMFNALYNRIKNRFHRHGMLIMISSPRFVDDFIEKKMEEAKTNHNIFTRRRASWENKPKELFSGKTFVMDGFTIPIEYETEAKRNFDRFKRDIMAIPSLVLEPYFQQWNLVEAGVDPNIPNPLNAEGKIKAEFRGKKGKVYYVHIDLSLVSDATGIAMCHEEEKKIIVDFMMQIKAPPGREIDLANIKGIVFGLKEMGFSIGKVTFDQFQSASSIQELNKHGFQSEKLSVDRDLGPYETFKDGVYAGIIKYYHYQPLMDELRRLELVNGKKVDHASGGSKDVADAVVGACFNCISNQNNFMHWVAGSSRVPPTPEEIKKEEATKRADGLGPYGYMHNRRGRG